jgi:hypothetical protein
MEEGRAAGLTPDIEPARAEVAATRAAGVTAEPPGDERPGLDVGHLKTQLRTSQPLDQVGLNARPRGPGAQERCACPVHRGDGRGRTFGVNLEEDVFQGFDERCGAKGDVIDLWAALHRQSLREAAADLARTFHLEPSPRRGTEKRNG